MNTSSSMFYINIELVSKKEFLSYIILDSMSNQNKNLIRKILMMQNL